MSLDICIEEQPTRYALEIYREAPMWKIPKVLEEDFPRLDRYASEKGGTRAGAPYVRYMDIDWPEMKNCGPLKMIWKMLTSKQPMRVGMSVASPVEGDGDIEAVTHDAGPCVRTIHKGPYQKVGKAYEDIVAWAEANNVEMANFTMENYINDPTVVAEEDIETLILIPVVS